MIAEGVNFLYHDEGMSTEHHYNDSGTGRARPSIMISRTLGLELHYRF